MGKFFRTPAHTFSAEGWSLTCSTYAATATRCADGWMPCSSRMCTTSGFMRCRYVDLFWIWTLSRTIEVAEGTAHARVGPAAGKRRLRAIPLDATCSHACAATRLGSD